MALNRAPDPDLTSGNAGAEDLGDDSFQEEADGQASIENLTPETQGSPIRRYFYSKLTEPFTSGK